MNAKRLTIIAGAVGLSLASFLLLRNQVMSEEPGRPVESTPEKSATPKKLATATFANGCFWCTEAVFQRLKGVQSVVSGYTGGKVPNPSYQMVGTGTTGHAEAVQITYDPAIITFDELLEVFWKTHDPTTLNSQGHDHGPQYRSGIFYHDEEQKKLAEHYKQKLTEAKAFPKPIVTEITAFDKFYPAENYHQNYFNLNSRQPYCKMVIRPKIEKLHRVFQSKLKPPAKPKP